MAGCFGDSDEDRWKEKETMGVDWDDIEEATCSTCDEELSDAEVCENDLCEECPDYKETCGSCSGSGEGMHERTACPTCNGKGRMLSENELEELANSDPSYEPPNREF